jgi:hypothetical protein
MTPTHGLLVSDVVRILGLGKQALAMMLKEVISEAYFVQSLMVADLRRSPNTGVRSRGVFSCLMSCVSLTRGSRYDVDSRDLYLSNGHAARDSD